MSDRSGGCGDAEQDAWCRRRFDEAHTSWYQYNYNWVDARCNGTVQLITGSSAYDGKDVYFCVDEYPVCRQVVGVTPLVLLFDDRALSFSPADSGASFDLGATGQAGVFDVPNAPWLVLDRNANGTVDSGAELFGSGSELGGTSAENGFAALAALDDNGDGLIDASDSAFAELALWADDGDWRSQPHELGLLSNAGAIAVSVTYDCRAECDARGNCAVERGWFRYVDACGVERTGRILDVHLPAR